MELNTTTSHATSEAKVTSAYWGYRELTADEVSAVAGGDDGDGGSADSGDWGDSGGYAGNTAGTEVADATAAASQDVALGGWAFRVIRDGILYDLLKELYKNGPQYDPNAPPGTYGYSNNADHHDAA